MTTEQFSAMLTEIVATEIAKAKAEIKAEIKAEMNVSQMEDWKFFSDQIMERFGVKLDAYKEQIEATISTLIDSLKKIDDKDFEAAQSLQKIIQENSSKLTATLNEYNEDIRKQIYDAQTYAETKVAELDKKLTVGYIVKNTFKAKE